MSAMCARWGGGRGGTFDSLLYSIWAETLPPWSWLPAMAWKGMCSSELALSARNVVRVGKK